MDSGIASILGTIVGALAGLAGGFLSGRLQSKLEYHKWLRSKKDDLDKDIRLAIAELTKKLAALVFSIIWISWKAKNYPLNFSERDISNYENEIRLLSHEISGARAVLGALSKDIHDQIRPIVWKLYELEKDVSQANSSFFESPSDAIKKLSDCFIKATDFDLELIEIISTILKIKHN